jgi:uncharacterized repeat protein (TIGR01451 family)
VPGNAYSNLSGTSMAGPHVVGVVALLLSAAPGLAGDPDAIEPALTATAVPRTTAEECGNVPGSDIPNNTYGWGRIDALAAVNAASADLSVSQTDSPDPTIPGTPITYTLTIQNAGPGTGLAVALGDTLSLQVSVDAATPSQGDCTLLTHGVECDLGSLAAGASATVDVTVTPSAAGVVTSAATVSAGAADPNTANNAFSEQTQVWTCPIPAPTVNAPNSVPANTDDLAASISYVGHSDVWTLTGGTVTGGQGTGAITFQSGDPGTALTFEVVDSIGDCETPGLPRTISIDFLDAPPENLFHDDVNKVARAGITAGCGGGNYCPDATVTRAQMAVFLLKGLHGGAYTPPACTGVFADVPCPGPFADWIEKLDADGITAGCGGGKYCPGASVTRAQMAVFLLKTLFGPSYAPNPATGTMFGDVPADAFAADWIEDLARRGITGGCGGGNYCPDAPNTRGQMAVFLSKTFQLPD